MTKEELRNIIKKEGRSEDWNYKGIKCKLRRTIDDCWAGYVFFPKELLLDVGSNQLESLKFHGGITCNQQSDSGNVMIGFDCAHSSDLIPSLFLNFNIPDNGISTYKTKNFAISQCNSLVDQFFKISQVALISRDNVLKIILEN